MLLLIHNGGLSGLDGETFYQVARSAVDHQRLDVGERIQHDDGHRWSRVRQIQRRPAAARWPIIYSLSTPVTWIAPAHADLVRTGLVGASMTVITAAIVVGGVLARAEAWRSSCRGADRRNRCRGRNLPVALQQGVLRRTSERAWNCDCHRAGAGQPPGRSREWALPLRCSPVLNPFCLIPV